MDNLKIKNFIDDSFKKYLEFTLSEKQVEQFFIFMNLLIEKNKLMNLTAIVEPEQIVLKHFVDSCFLAKNRHFYDNKNNNHYTFIDIGSGAGFPAIPMAIMFPIFNFTLVDSLNKRINFVNEVINEIGLTNTTAIHYRAEDLSRDEKYREKFDFALARGVSKISVLTEYLTPFLKVDGSMLIHKMDDCDEEIEESSEAFSKLNSKYVNKESYTLLESEPKRAIIEIQKLSKTPSIYPRKQAVINKKPL